MKKIAFLALLSVFLALPLFGQNAPIPTQTISTSFEAVSLPGNGHTLAATIEDIGISPTTNSTLFFESLQAPTAPSFASFYGAGAAYQLNFLSKWINDASPNLSGYRFRFSLIGSAGQDTVGSRNHFGGTARFRAEYAMTASGTWNLAFEAGAARMPDLSPGWGKLISIGVPIHF